MSRKRLILVLVGGVLLLVLFAAILLRRASANKTPPITVTLAGFTNVAVGAQIAVFTLSNNGPAPVICVSVYVIEDKANPLSYTMDGGPGSERAISRHQSRAYFVPAPARSTTWRPIFYTTADTWRWKLLQNAPRWLHKIIPARFFSYSVHGTPGPWINDQPSQPEPLVIQRMSSIVVRKPSPPPPLTAPLSNSPSGH